MINSYSTDVLLTIVLYRKTKKSENKENDSSAILSAITPDKNLTNDKIHIDITEHSSDQLLLRYDSSESSPRDLSSLSSPPAQKVRKRSIVTNKTYRVSARHSDEKFFNHK